MKRILAIILCLLVLSISPISAFAEENDSTPVETTTTVGNETTDSPVEDETEGETEDSLTPPNETTPEGDYTPEGDALDEEGEQTDSTLDVDSTEGDVTDDVTPPAEDETEQGTNTPTEEDTSTGEEIEGDTPIDTPEEDVAPPEETPKEDTTENPEAEPPAENTPEDSIEDTVVDTPTEESFVENVKQTLTDTIANWIAGNMDWLSIVLTIIGYGVYGYKKHKATNKALSVFNNNTVAVATESQSFMTDALEKITGVSAAVTSYDDRIVTLLEAFETTAEDKKRLEDELVEIKKYLKTSSLANIEFANELAELLALANIPNCKKDEIGTRHLEAVRAIMEAEAKAEAVAEGITEVEEVNENDGEEA